MHRREDAHGLMDERNLDFRISLLRSHADYLPLQERDDMSRVLRVIGVIWLVRPRADS